MDRRTFIVEGANLWLPDICVKIALEERRDDDLSGARRLSQMKLGRRFPL